MTEVKGIMSENSLICFIFLHKMSNLISIIIIVIIIVIIIIIIIFKIIWIINMIIIWKL